MIDRYLGHSVTASISADTKDRLLAASRLTGRPQAEIVRAGIEIALFRIESGWALWDREWDPILRDVTARNTTPPWGRK